MDLLDDPELFSASDEEEQEYFDEDSAATEAVDGKDASVIQGQEVDEAANKSLTSQQRTQLRELRGRVSECEQALFDLDRESERIDKDARTTRRLVEALQGHIQELDHDMDTLLASSSVADSKLKATITAKQQQQEKAEADLEEEETRLSSLMEDLKRVRNQQLKVHQELTSLQAQEEELSEAASARKQEAEQLARQRANKEKRAARNAAAAKAAKEWYRRPISAAEQQHKPPGLTASTSSSTSEAAAAKAKSLVSPAQARQQKLQRQIEFKAQMEEQRRLRAIVQLKQSMDRIAEADRRKLARIKQSQHYKSTLNRNTDSAQADSLPSDMPASSSSALQQTINKRQAQELERIEAERERRRQAIRAKLDQEEQQSSSPLKALSSTSPKRVSKQQAKQNMQPSETQLNDLMPTPINSRISSSSKKKAAHDSAVPDARTSDAVREDGGDKQRGLGTTDVDSIFPVDLDPSSALIGELADFDEDATAFQTGQVDSRSTAAHEGGEDPMLALADLDLAMDTMLGGPGTDELPLAQGSPDESPQLQTDDENEGVSHRARGLSKLERNILNERIEKQKQNKVQDQVVAGRVFRGTPFASKPAELVFEDFDVGKTYKQSMTLTNVSYSVNTFQLAPQTRERPPDGITVHFNPPGALSPGLSAEVVVSFRPLENVDVDGHLHFLATTGPFSIPVRCLKKRVDINVTTTNLSYGRIVRGETKSNNLTISNKGALATQYELSIISDEADSTAKPNGSEELQPFFFSEEVAASGVMLPHSTLNVPIEFKPEDIGSYAAKCHIRFSDAETDDVDVILSGTSTDVPVFFEDSVLDFRTCIFGKKYASTVFVNNRGLSAAQVTIVPVTNAAANFLVVKPKTAICPPGERLRIALEFRPEQSMLDILSKFIDEDTFMMELPLQLSAEGQTVKGELIVKAHVSPGLIEVEPALLDFGRISVDDSSILPVSLTNTCALPQRFGFVKLPPFIEVQPNDGFGTLLPFETINVNVIVNPFRHAYEVDDVKRSFALTIEGDCSDRPCKLKGIFTAVTPELSLSSSVVNFTATSPGHISRATLTVLNDRPYSVDFHAVLDNDEVDVDVLPPTGTIAAGQSFQLMLQFRPRPISLRPSQHHTQQDQADAGLVDQSLPAEPRGTAARSRSSKRKSSSKSSSRQPTDDTRSESTIQQRGHKQSDGQSQTTVTTKMTSLFDGDQLQQLLDAKPTVQRANLCVFSRKSGADVRPSDCARVALSLPIAGPKVVVLANSTCPQDGSGADKLSFGNVPVGDTRYATVALGNLTESELRLKASALPTDSSFMLVRALRACQAAKLNRRDRAEQKPSGSKVVDGETEQQAATIDDEEKENATSEKGVLSEGCREKQEQLQPSAEESTQSAGPKRIQIAGKTAETPFGTLGVTYLIVAFAPRAEAQYTEELKLHFQDQELSFTLLGSGVTPTLHLHGTESELDNDSHEAVMADCLGQPAPMSMPTACTLAFGDIALPKASDAADLPVLEKLIKIYNPSKIGLNYKIVMASHTEKARHQAIASPRFGLHPTTGQPVRLRETGDVGELAKHGGDVFEVSPPSGHVSAGQYSTINVRFRPDHASSLFRDTAWVYFSRQEPPLKIDLRGRCWTSPTFLVGCEPVPGTSADVEAATGKVEAHKGELVFTVSATDAQSEHSGTRRVLAVGSPAPPAEQKQRRNDKQALVNVTCDIEHGDLQVHHFELEGSPSMQVPVGNVVPLSFVYQPLGRVATGSRQPALQPSRAASKAGSRPHTAQSIKGQGDDTTAASASSQLTVTDTDGSNTASRSRPATRGPGKCVPGQIHRAVATVTLQLGDQKSTHTIVLAGYVV